jgi:hypothetical protein
MIAFVLKEQGELADKELNNSIFSGKRIFCLIKLNVKALLFRWTDR